MPMNQLEKKRAVGARGSWYAEVDGESLPCVHSYWFETPHYNNPEARPDIPRSAELVQIVRKKRRVIMQRDDIPNKNKDGQTILT
jgi:hypothetical protein